MSDYIVLLYIVQAFAHVFVCVYMAINCFENQLRFSKKMTHFVATIFIFISILIIELFLERTAPFIRYSTPAGVIWAFLAIGFCFACIRTKLFHVMFLVFFLLNVSLKSMYISRAVYALDIASGDLFYILISIFVWLSMIPFIWYLILVLFKKLVNLENVGSHLNWLFVLPFAYFLFYIMAAEEKFLASDSWSGLFALQISNVATYLSYVSVMIMFLKMRESLAENAKAELFEQMILAQSDQYEHMRESMEKISRIKHDYRHNLVVVKNFVDSNDLTGLEKYLDLCEMDGVDFGEVFDSNSSFVDILLSYYSGLAKANDIFMEVAVNFPKGFNVPDNEMVALFGNLLENAFESCKRQVTGERFIDVKTKVVSSSMVAIKVVNSYSDKIVKSGDSFLSGKRKGLGVGTSTIKFISEKHGGSCAFSFSEGVFKACVLLIVE